ncbi:MAG TPA: hypothetical protein DCM64_03650 [Gammaproteobacteria bacterium]|nr:NF038104 family lipoprotein [Gammaproteobacteria bacterium]HAJ75530.1 hypothetical protein [Gammaproteobacteria bacterium]|tara:strand:- start:249 stop:437 length:189 start_codon:yes stop_codon:yes gene_type:complete
MSSRLLRRFERLLFVIVLCLALNSCVGAVLGVAVDTTIGVVKVPFKLVGAAADLAIPDDDDD